MWKTMSRDPKPDDIDQSDKDAIQSQGYLLTSLIGKGSFGRVYQAFDDHGHEYAIKAVQFRKMAHKSLRSHSAFDEFATSKVLSTMYYEVKNRRSSRRLSSGATKLTRPDRPPSPSLKRIFGELAALIASSSSERTSEDLSEDDCVGGFDKNDRGSKVLSEDLMKLKNASKQDGYEGVVVIYDVFVKGLSYFLVMEKLNGETLESYVRRQTEPLPEAQVKRYMFQMLKGLNFLWKNGIVHRDIKPENIMFTEKDCKELKFIDLGLGRFIPLSPEFDDCLLPFVDPSQAEYNASVLRKNVFFPSKLFSDPSGDAYKTIENLLVKYIELLEEMKESKTGLKESDLMRSPIGTPFYVSPEVVNGRGYTRNCDIWSLGMCFYFMATGKDLVRRRPSSFSREKKMVWENASRGGFVLQDVNSPDINRIICHMLCKNPKSPEDLLSDPWFDECREELHDYSSSSSDMLFYSQMGYNFRSC